MSEDVLDHMRANVESSPYADEIIMRIGDRELTPRQILEEATNGTPLGLTLRNAYQGLLNRQHQTIQDEASQLG